MNSGFIKMTRPWWVGNTKSDLSRNIYRLEGAKYLVKQNENTCIILVDAMIILAMMNGMQAWCIKPPGHPVPPWKHKCMAKKLVHDVNGHACQYQ